MPSQRGPGCRTIAPVKQLCRIPAWQLRDLPGRTGLFACFLEFVIALITGGLCLVGTGKPGQCRSAKLADLRPAAGSTPACALWRKACGRLGYSPGLAMLGAQTSPPTPMNPWPISAAAWSRCSTSRVHLGAIKSFCARAGVPHP